MRELDQMTIGPVRGPETAADPPGIQRRETRALDTIVALLGLGALDLVIKVKGFPFLYRIVKAWPVSIISNPSADTIARICSTVDRACTYYLKRALCLQRSALTTCLLRRHGVKAEMVIGCRVMPYHGHAWVEVDGKVVNDNQKVQEFYSVLERC
jgi:hypothetical protein